MIELGVALKFSLQTSDVIIMIAVGAILFMGYKFLVWKYKK